MTERGIAKYVRTLDRWDGGAILYQLHPPIEWEDDGTKKHTRFVIVSATWVPFVGGVETYIFPAGSDGEPLNMLELDGSFKGGWDQERALNNAGYDVVSEAEFASVASD